MSKGKKVGYKGPRVSQKIVALDEAGRKAWLASLKVSPDELKAITARLEKAVAKGSKPRKINIENIKASLVGQPIAVLAEIQKSIEPLIKAGRQSEIERIRKEMADQTAALAALEA